MTPTPSDRATLRLNVDEVVPPGGTADDTLFGDAMIDAFLTASNSVEEASWRAWRAKGLAVMDPNRLVSASVGSETLKFVDPKELAKVASDQADYWYGLIPAGSTTPSYGSVMLAPAGPDLPGITDYPGGPASNAPYVTEVDLSRLEW